MLQSPASDPADLTAGVGDDPLGAGVAGSSSSTSPRTVSPAPWVGPQQIEHRVGRRHGLEAAAVPAAANGTVGADADVPELAREAGHAAVELPVEHDPGADARRDHDVDHVRQAAAGAERDLGERAEVRVVVDRDLKVEPLA